MLSTIVHRADPPSSVRGSGSAGGPRAARAAGSRTRTGTPRGSTWTTTPSSGTDREAWAEQHCLHRPPWRIRSCATASSSYARSNISSFFAKGTLAWKLLPFARTSRGRRRSNPRGRDRGRRFCSHRGLPRPPCRTIRSALLSTTRLAPQVGPQLRRWTFRRSLSAQRSSEGSTKRSISSACCPISSTPTRLSM